MKKILDSSEAFQAYARIDFCYYGIEEAKKELDRLFPKSLTPIDKMIYEQTGYTNDKTLSIARNVKSLLKSIIKDKKIIDADYSTDEEMLKAIIKVETACMRHKQLLTTKPSV